MNGRVSGPLRHVWSVSPRACMLERTPRGLYEFYVQSPLEQTCLGERLGASQAYMVSSRLENALRASQASMVSHVVIVHAWENASGSLRHVWLVSSRACMIGTSPRGLPGIYGRSPLERTRLERPRCLPGLQGQSRLERACLGEPRGLPGIYGQSRLERACLGEPRGLPGIYGQSRLEHACLGEPRDLPGMYGQFTPRACMLG